MGLRYECFVFLGMCLAGGALGLWFDTVRTLRRPLPGRPVISGIADGIFWLLAALLFWSALYNFSSGRIRAYEFLGAGLGLLLYFCLLSRAVRFILEKILKIIGLILKYLLTPPVFLSKILLESLCRKRDGSGRKTALKERRQ